MLTIATCINVEIVSFGIYDKEGLCSLLLHASTTRLQFLVYIMKKLMVRHYCMHEWRDRDFRYML